MSGIKKFLVKRLARKLGFRFRKLIRYEQDLRLAVPRPRAKIPLTFRELKAEDLDSVPFLDPQDLPELRERFRRGHFAVAAFHQDRLAAFRWLNPFEAYEITTGIRFPLRTGEIYSYQKLVDPALRNLGVGAQLGWEGNRMTLEKGYFRKVSFIEARNRANRRSTSKNRNVPVGLLIFIQLFGLRFQKYFPWQHPPTEQSAGRTRKKDQAQES